MTFDWVGVCQIILPLEMFTAVTSPMELLKKTLSLFKIRDCFFWDLKSDFWVFTDQMSSPVSKEKHLNWFSMSITKALFSKLQDSKSTSKVIKTLSKRYEKRNGGYTRIVKLGNRYGDNAPTAIIELVDRDEDAKGLDSGPVIEKKITEEEQLPQN